MSKRRIEVFTAGCGLCEEVVQVVRDAACDSCDVEVRSTQDEGHAEAARGYGIRRLPLHPNIVAVLRRPAGDTLAGQPGGATEQERE